MAIRKNRAFYLVALLAVIAAPAYGQNYDELSRSDSISLSAGDANRANTAIQTPTPWPRYLNDFDFDMPGQQGVDLMTNFLGKYAAGSTVTKTITQDQGGITATTQVK